VGIGKEEDASHTPAAKNGKVSGYPWGKEFPPPAKTGNYNGEETSSNPVSGQKPIPGYNGGFDRTAPVGSFPANALGLFDLGGNGYEWCQDCFDPSVN
jgi:formylglycine-generating enzyme required for sulfatase activity